MTMVINVTIRGNSPLLCNRFTDEAAMKASSGTSSAMTAGSKGLPRDQAERKLYIGTDGKPVIPGPNIFRSIIDGGTFHKSGKQKITTNKSSLVPAGIAIIEIEVPIWIPDTKKSAEWEPDSRAVVIPSTGGRVMCHRPRFDSWQLSFTLEVDETMFDQSLVRAIVDDAGRRIGLGDFRPARKGPFGRFTVTHWAVKELEKPEQKSDQKRKAA